MNGTLTREEVDSIVTERLRDLNNGFTKLNSSMPRANMIAKSVDGHHHMESIELFDEGTSQGFGYQIDVVGTGVSVTRTGRKFTASIPGSQIINANATASLTLTTTAQSIIGNGNSSKVRLLLPQAALWIIIGTFDFDNQVVGTGALVGELYVNDSATAETAQAVLATDGVDRVTVTQTWAITTTVANTPVEIKARKTGAGGTGICTQVHTKISAAGGSVVVGTAHGNLSGLLSDDHTQYVLLAGRAGTANNIKLSTDSTGILTGSGASGGKLQLIGTSHATPGVVEVQRASVGAMLQGLIGVEANPRWQLLNDRLVFGPGGATAPQDALIRTAARQFTFEAQASGAVGPTIQARNATETQPRIRLRASSAVSMDMYVGPGGTTTPDTGWARGTTNSIGQPGMLKVDNYLALPDKYTAFYAADTGTSSGGNSSATLNDTTKAWTTDQWAQHFVTITGGLGAGQLRIITSNAATVLTLSTAWTVTPDATSTYSLSLKPQHDAGIGYLYNYVPGGIGSSRLFYEDDTGHEYGPIGLLQGLLGRNMFPLGGFSVNNGWGAMGLSGFDFYGLLGRPTAYAASSVDAAFSPAVTLTANITSSVTTFTYTSTGDPIRIGDIIVIGSEHIAVLVQSDFSTNTLVVRRGEQGTTPAAHTAGDPITLAGCGTSGIRTLIDFDGHSTAEFDTGTVINTPAGLEWDIAYDMHANPLLVMQFEIKNITNARFFLGLTNKDLATMLGSDTPGPLYSGLSFSTSRGDTYFKAVSFSGVPGLEDLNLVDTSYAPSETIRFFVVIEQTASLQIGLFDGTWGQLSKVNVPSVAWETSGCRLVCGIQNLTAASKRIRLSMGNLLIKAAA